MRICHFFGLTVAIAGFTQADEVRLAVTSIPHVKTESAQAAILGSGYDF